MRIQQCLSPRDLAPLLLAALLAFAPVPSGAVVLGEPVYISKIGEPLRIEIPVLRGATSQLGECLRLVQSPPGPDGVPRVQNARLGIAGRGPAPRLVITHPRPSLEPALAFAIEETCDGHLRREYTVLLAFPDTAAAAWESAGEQATPWSGAANTSPPASKPARRPHGYRRAASPADVVAASPAAHGVATPGHRASQEPAGRDRLELGGGESGTPGAGLHLSTQLGSLARIDSTTEAQREQLRREQSVTMAIDRTIVAQLELDERIRQIEAMQSRMLAEHTRTQPAPTPPPADATATGAPPPVPQPPAPDAAEAWKRGTLAVGLASLALAAALAWFHERRRKSLRRNEAEAQCGPVPTPIPPPARQPLPRIEPAAETGFSPRPTPPLAPEARPAEHSLPEWETAQDLFAPPASIAPIAPAAPNATDEAAEEHESAIELAEIMMEFGRIRGAADTLAEFITSNPKKAVTPWLKLMEVYRTADLRDDFNALAKQLNKTFNVKAVTWDSFEEARRAESSIEQMAHLTRSIQDTWGTRDCQAYLEHLLRDNRDGTRDGFPLSVIDEILVLAAILEDRLGAYRPDATPATPPSGESAPPSRPSPPEEPDGRRRPA